MTRSLFAMLLVFAVSLNSFGQQPVMKWDNSVGRPGVNGSIYKLIPFGNLIVAGGEFTTAGGDAANSLAGWNNSTRQWEDIGGGVTLGEYVGIVNDATTFESGQSQKLCVVGHFDHAGDVSASAVAIWDGSTWTSPQDGLPYGELVGRAAVTFDNTIWISIDSGGPTHSVYKFYEQANEWVEVGQFPSSIVFLGHLELGAEATIVAGGNPHGFPSYFYGAQYWDNLTEEWQDFGANCSIPIECSDGPTPGPAARVRSIANYGSAEYFGFDTVLNPENCPLNTGHLNTLVGFDDDAFVRITDPDNVFDLDAYSTAILAQAVGGNCDNDQVLYLGGSIASSQSIDPVGMVIFDGQNLSSPQGAVGGEVYTLSASGNEIYVGGGFGAIHGAAYGAFARYYCGCVADFDDSGFVDFDDYNLFVSAYGDGDPIADIDGSGFVDFDDFTGFATHYAEGC